MMRKRSKKTFDAAPAVAGNGLIDRRALLGGEAEVINAQTLPKVQMPDRDNFMRIYPTEP